MSIANRRWALFAILAAAFAAPMAYSLYFHIRPAVDAAAYDTIALNILAGKGFVERNSENILFDNSISRAGPVYEYFLAGIYAVAGHHYEAVWFVQALLHAATALLLFLIARSVFLESGAVIGLATAAIFGLHPDLIEISAMLMTETLYLFLVTLAIFLFVKVWERPDRLWLGGLFGFVMGGAILARPPVLFFLPIIAIFYAFRRRYAALAVFAAVLALTLTPWVVRNYQIYHQVVLTTMIGEYNIWIGNTLVSSGGQLSEGYNPASQYTTTYGYEGFKDAARSHFWAFTLEHPFVMVKLVLLRMVRYFSLIRPMGFWFYQQGIGQAVFIASSLVAIAFLFIAGFSGLVMALYERKKLFYYLAGFALAAPVALLPAVVESRYRFQIYPFLALFSAYFVVRGWRDHRAAQKPLLLAGGVLLAVSAIDVVVFWQTVYERLAPIFQ
ncbi:MAG: glycosyltransferase family 39 protein [Candidatus Niyogibacteria bacterium]|nr:glycosyltransferase family 39 protein [Candidatus Niyogibacteria bacterium]